VSDYQHKLITAICARAAECWAGGNVSLAQSWFGSAVLEVGDNEYVDTDEDATR
jgi:hypothetical protein